jgi:hypothetical protein
MKVFLILLTALISVNSSAQTECNKITKDENIRRHRDQVVTAALIGPLLESSDSLENKDQACALVRFLETDIKSVLCSAQKTQNDPNDGWYNVIRNKTAALEYSKPISSYCEGQGDLQKARDTYKGTSDTDMFPAYDPLNWE